MKGTAFAIAIAALTVVGVSGTQAAPIAPLSSGVAADHGNLTQVQWRWRHWHHHHCWRWRCW
jgi:hypothetical protein